MNHISFHKYNQLTSFLNQFGFFSAFLYILVIEFARLLLLDDIENSIHGLEIFIFSKFKKILI